MYVANVGRVLFWAIGAIEGMLLARLVLRLFAARPDNPAVAALFAATAALRVPLLFLDAGQPQFGAVLELSTLALLVLLPAAALVIARLWRPQL